MARLSRNKNVNLNKNFNNFYTIKWLFILNLILGIVNLILLLRC